MQIERWRQDMRPQEVIVSRAKIHYEDHYGLMGPLSNLGATDAFNPGTADLSGIVDTTSRNLYVSKATHDAYVDVNEEVTEAAAVTTIVTGFELASPSPQSPRFTADHPFIFIIQDERAGDPVHGKAVGSHGIAWGLALLCFAHRSASGLRRACSMPTGRQ